MNDIVLSIYPLSSRFGASLQAASSARLDYLSLGQIRAMPPKRMVFHLRAMNPDRLVLAFEDKDSGALSPILKLVAGITRARQLFVASPDGKLVSFGRRELVRELSGLVLATCKSWWSAIATRRDLSVPSAPVPMSARVEGPSRKALYLNANLWFGVKAGGSVGHISGVSNGLMDAGYDLDFATCGGRLVVDGGERHSAHPTCDVRPAERG